MAYQTNLQWQTRLSEFDDNEQKVLLALSQDVNGFVDATNLGQGLVDAVLPRA
jgi:hypothetical protein